MPDVTYAPDAESDLIGIVEYIARDKPVAAREWLMKIRETCDTIASHPHMGESRRALGIPDCQSFSVGNYVIFFRRVQDGIEVARIIHGSRDV